MDIYMAEEGKTRFDRIFVKVRRAGLVFAHNVVSLLNYSRYFNKFQRSPACGNF